MPARAAEEISSTVKIQRVRRFAFGVLLMGVMLAAATLQAHVTVVKTAPADEASLTASPREVRVWFNQKPSARISRLQLRGPSGEIVLEKIQVDAKERSISAAIPEPLAPGTYEATWRTAGDDGHVMRGTFTFSVASAK